MIEPLWKGCAASNFRAGRPAGMKPEAIVIHIADGSADGTDQWFNNSSANVSAHYLVAFDGAVHQYVHESDTAFHAGIVVDPTWTLIKPGMNPNFYTIGIEHEGHPEDAWPEEQMNAGATLVAEIAARWQIALDTDHVIGHHMIRATKTCPGTQISPAKLVELAAEAANGAPGEAKVGETTAALRVRESASVDSAILRVLPLGSRVLIIGTAAGSVVSGNGTWFAISPVGYVWAGGIKIVE